ncbi:hydrogenase formation protein HypD [bacterium]|nr:MAG: hydrogenase formation protein HypD [bacterium]
MKYLDEFRDPGTARSLVERITQTAGQIPHEVKIMEICGSHTVAIFRTGIKSLLPPNVTLVSGPGCPVCVTAMPDMDRMIAIPKRVAEKNPIIATFGDMLRVPGTWTSLEKEKAEGADVRIAASPLDSVQWAEENPDREVIFLGVGFETTSPTIAAVVERASKSGLRNFSVYPAFKLLPPALQALLESPGADLDGFLCPGHVSVMLGSDAYRPYAEKYGKPCAIAGFEPLDILLGISELLIQLVDKKHEVINTYGRAVSAEGNTTAMDLLFKVYRPADAPWRGLGTIPDSGLSFSDEYREFDAVRRFGLDDLPTGSDPKECGCSQVLTGVLSPPDCPLFDNGCTPEMPVGSCMVSSEGSCAAWYRYGRTS